jgi:hypothetical protein
VRCKCAQYRSKDYVDQGVWGKVFGKRGWFCGKCIGHYIGDNMAMHGRGSTIGAWREWELTVQNAGGIFPPDSPHAA